MTQWFVLDAHDQPGHESLRVSYKFLNRRDLLKQAALSTLALRTSDSIAQLSASVSSAKKRAINALQLEPFVDPYFFHSRCPP